MRIGGPTKSKSPIIRYRLHILFSTFLLIDFSRGRFILTHGRFFAEEGSYYWAHALKSNFFEQITFVAPKSGYLLLISNISTEFSVIFPNNYSPLITSWFALMVMTLPFLIAYIFKPGWVSLKLDNAVLITLLISGPVMVAEVFANTINSQIFLALTFFIFIIYYPRPSKTWKYIFTFIFLISFLSGWYSLCLLPSYAIRILTSTKNSFHTKIFVLGLTMSCLQIGVYIYSVKSSLLLGNRGHFFANLEKLPRGILGLVKFVFFFNRFDFLLLLLFVFFLFYRILIQRQFRFEKHDYSKFYSIPLVVCFVALVSELALITFGGTGGFSGRYITVPGTIGIIGVFILIASLENINRIFSYLMTFLLTVLLISSFTSAYHYENDLLACEKSCISWEKQVQQVTVGIREYWVHWPYNDSPSGWRTNVVSPTVELPHENRSTYR